MKPIIGLLALLLPLFGGAQAPPAGFIGTGNFVPDIVFHEMINYQDTTAKISDFKGKLIILDFWSTYCGTCIKAFPKIDSLQNQFKDQIQFILVTHFPVNRSGKDCLLKVFDTWKQKGMYLPKVPIAAGNNENIIALFPHEYIPHYVWINSKGRLSAVTSYELMNENTIQTLLNSK